MADTRLIQSRYRLLELIGRGGMGEVWRARDESLGRQVAVKCLKPLGPQHDQAFTRVLRERFRREARVAASLQHRGVTVVHDFGEHDGVLYLVMELLDGQNLSQLLEENEQHPLPVDHVVDIAEQVADALGYTHRQGIVHRDLKPANIMRLTDGTVKICDFGIARLGRDIGMSSRLTTTGIAMGTPHYMSPEQISGEEVDHRSDLYSLGCVLYEIATGVPPFDQEDAWGVLVGHRDTPPQPPRTHRAELPRFLDRVVLDLLAKTPDERPADAGDLRRRIVLGRSGEQPVPGPLTFGTGVARDPALPAWTRTMTPGRRAASPARRGAGPLGPEAGLTGRWTAARADGEPRPVTTEPEGGDGVAGAVGVAVGRTGRAEEALRAFGQAAAGRARTLGPDHPHTLAAREETANALGQLGRHTEAHQVYEALLAVHERTLGPDHPDTLRCRHNLAYNLGRLGRPKEAWRAAREVAEARARLLGPLHPDTLATRCEAAHALGALGRHAEALETYQDVAHARASALGDDHPDTFAARYETGISLGRLGRHAEALELYRSLVEDRTRTAGAADPETLRARHGLGVNLGRMGRWEEALSQARQVCALRERTLGPDHPDTVVSRREVAVGMGWLGRWDDALVAYRQVAEAHSRALGPGHPRTLAARNDEAHCLERLGRSPEAAELHRSLAAHRARNAAPPG
ncbi:serine/threonine-protein kinase [Streptomyces sp. NPDC049916]|uniref:serine/threonine-protein kinase n=1 Tax=Streptomyces sp. NPDC049916 TaxID=3155156 RepID=UPI003441A658